jgi:CheY-like chemotaxis protein
MTPERKKTVGKAPSKSSASKKTVRAAPRKTSPSAPRKTTPKSTMPVVLFVEDELALIEEIPVILARDGIRVVAAMRPAEAMKIIREEKRIDLAVMDLQLPHDGCPEIAFRETGGGRFTGLVLARELRKRFPHIPVIFWTSAASTETKAAIRSLGKTWVIPKSAGPAPVMDLVRDQFKACSDNPQPRILLVHGHDEPSLSQLKHYLVDRLKFPPPVVLREKAAFGQTIIEKIETYAPTTDIVFVLLTPDDRVLLEGTSQQAYRARQNVILELGFFMGLLGRTSGKIILLYRKPVELPSDIGGMVLVDITNGIEAAHEAIVREVQEWI